MKDLVYEKVWNSRASGNLEVETTGKKIVNNQKDTNAYKLLQLEQWETPKPIKVIARCEISDEVKSCELTFGIEAVFRRSSVLASFAPEKSS